MGKEGGRSACCVTNCNNNARNSSCLFYSFPVSKWKLDQRNKWIAAVNKTNDDRSQWQPEYKHLICSDHFIGGQKSDEQTKPNYVPTIFPPREDITSFLLTHKEMQMIHISEKYPHREDDQVRDVVYNVYTYLKNESEEFQNAKEGYFTDVITRVSEATGVSPSYVSDVVNGYATVGPEAFLKYSLETPQPVSKKDRKESCDSIPEDVKTPQKKRRKKGSRAPWGKRKKSDCQKEVLKLENRWKYEMNPIDDSNKSFKIDDRSLNELHSTHNFNKISENSKAKISIKNEPSFDIDIVENPLPNIYDQIEESENGHLVNVKQENAPLNNEDLPIPVALFSNQITDKKDPNDNKEEVENEILTGI